MTEHELARADREHEERLNIPPSPYIWLMDSDFCDNCGELLDLSDCDGLCFVCSELYFADCDRDEDDWRDFNEDEQEVPPQK